MTNWIIVGIAIVIAAFLVVGVYQPVSVQGPNGTYLNGSYLAVPIG